VLDGVELVSEIDQVADGADVVALLTEWPEFAKVDLAAMADAARDGATVVDTRNLLEPELVREAGLGYDGVGRR
jgi:UDPglucose 6-dehydrogenase